MSFAIKTADVTSFITPHIAAGTRLAIASATMKITICFDTGSTYAHGVEDRLVKRRRLARDKTAMDYGMMVVQSIGDDQVPATAGFQRARLPYATHLHLVALETANASLCRVGWDALLEYRCTDTGEWLDNDVVFVIMSHLFHSDIVKIVLRMVRRPTKLTIR